MQPDSRIQEALEAVVQRRKSSGCPPRLANAIDHAVFPGGHRIRPRLCLAVATACGEDNSAIADAAAISIELLHCASLVHDDMPCFDNAPIRRGKPSVHAAYGERLALLTGDALIVLAFQALAEGACKIPQRLCALVTLIGAQVGLPRGIVAGQAWECEENIPLELYQRAKTGALFAASTMAGAAAAGVDSQPWSQLGKRMGEAYQVADDLLDRFGDPDVIGKPVGQDAALQRPNSVAQLGIAAATERLHSLVAEAIQSIPACPGEDELRVLIEQESHQFIQLALARQAAA